MPNKTILHFTAGLKRRFGEYLFSIKEGFRTIEKWLRTILWNVMIYPRRSLLHEVLALRKILYIFSFLL